MTKTNTNNEENRKSLSEREQKVLSKLSSRGKSIINLEDIQNAANVSYDTARDIARNLVKKKWVDRIERGKYLIIPLSAGEKAEYTGNEYVIGTSMVEEGYISFWSALDYFGWTEQTPMKVYVATRKRKKEKKVHGVSYKFINLNENKYFGYRDYSAESEKVKFATPEKALIDCADHPEYCGGIRELAKCFKNAASEIEPDKLVEFLIKQGNGAAIKRIAFLSDIIDLKLPKRQSLEEKFTTGYSKLDPTIDKKGSHSSQYKLELNISEREIRREIG